MDWLDLFSSEEYELPAEMAPGDQFVGGAGFPDATVRSSELLYPRRTLVQRADLDVTDGVGEKQQKIRVYRTLVELEDGEIVEVNRRAVPGAEEESADESRCAACLEEIPEGQAVIHDGKAYHRRCMGGEDDADDSDRRTRAGARSHRPRRSREDGDGQEGNGAPPATQAPRTITRTRSDDGISVSHLVSVVEIDDDREAVTLWAREYGARSGTVVGRWPSGLFNGELPMDHDVKYIDEKFYASDGLVTASDLRIWNRLYKAAMRELRPVR